MIALVPTRAVRLAASHPRRVRSPSSAALMNVVVLASSSSSSPMGTTARHALPGSHAGRVGSAASAATALGAAGSIGDGNPGGSHHHVLNRRTARRTPAPGGTGPAVPEVSSSAHLGPSTECRLAPSKRRSRPATAGTT